MLKLYALFAILCVCTLADTITPHFDCATHYLSTKTVTGSEHSFDVYMQWDLENKFYVYTIGWKVERGVNKTFDKILRSDLKDDDPTHGLSIEYPVGYTCKSSVSRPADFAYESTDGPTDSPCPDGSSGCVRYDNSQANTFIILDAMNRIVKTDYDAIFTYFDDYPALNLFGVKRCSGVGPEQPPPSESICGGEPSYSSSSSSSSSSSPVHGSSSSSSSPVHGSSSSSSSPVHGSSSSSSPSSAHPSSSIHSSSSTEGSLVESFSAVSSSSVLVVITAAVIAVVASF